LHYRSTHYETTLVHFVVIEGFPIIPRAQWGHYGLGDFNMTNKPSFTKNITTRICFTCEGKKCWLKMISKDHQQCFKLRYIFYSTLYYMFFSFKLVQWSCILSDTLKSMVSIIKIYNWTCYLINDDFNYVII